MTGWTIEYSPNFHAILCHNDKPLNWFWSGQTLGLDGVEMITGLCFTAALFCQFRFAVHCGSIVLMRSQSKRFKEQFIHTTTGFAILYGLATIITAAIGGYVL